MSKVKSLSQCVRSFVVRPSWHFLFSPNLQRYSIIAFDIGGGVKKWGGGVDGGETRGREGMVCTTINSFHDLEQCVVVVVQL